MCNKIIVFNYSFLLASLGSLPNNKSFLMILTTKVMDHQGPPVPPQQTKIHKSVAARKLDIRMLGRFHLYNRK